MRPETCFVTLAVILSSEFGSYPLSLLFLTVCVMVGMPIGMFVVHVLHLDDYEEA